MAAPIASFMPWVRLRTRRALPDLGFSLSGPALVLGAGPGARKPHGYGADWTLVTANAAQVSAEALGLPEPDIAVMHRGVFVGIDPADDYKRELLSGRGARHLVVPIWPGPVERLAQGSARFSYRYETLDALDKWRLAHLVWRLCGVYVATSRGWQRRISTGIFAIFLARYLGAGPLVLSGFSLSASGHFYDSRGSFRHHVDEDARLIRLALDAGVPLFATEPDFASESGVPLWTG